jgi:hypothetical protein
VIAKTIRPTRGTFSVELTDIFCVMWVTGLSYQKILQLVEGGNRSHPGFQWVWNFATKPGGERTLRFWRKEIEDVRAVAQLTLPEVLASILPLNRKNFPAGEVNQLFTLNPTSLMRLRDQLGGQLQPSGSVFHRAGLERFLRVRWLGPAIHMAAPRQQSGCNAAAV